MSCSNISIKFDPFLDISLPLPSKSFNSFSIFFVSLSDKFKSKEFKVTLKLTHSIGDLKVELAKSLGVSTNSSALRNLILVHVIDDEIAKYFLNDAESISIISPNDDIYCYYIVDEFPNLPSVAKMTLPIVQRVSFPRLTEDRKGYETVSRAVSFPFLSYVPRQFTYAELKKFVQVKVNQLMEISSPKIEGDTLDLISNFTLSKFNEQTRKSIPILRQDNSIVSFDDDEALAIEWCPVGLVNERFSRLKFDEVVDISPDGNDMGTTLTIGDCLKAFTSEEKMSVDDSWYFSGLPLF